MTPKPVRADLHCHSTASQVAKLGISRSIGLPECATPPQEVYELAKSRGMDFVTITDHDTIDGALEIAHLPDVFVSEELTTWFRGERHAVHVLCWGIDAADHEFLQSNARDLETCAAYLAEHEIACSLAHPFFSVAAPLEQRHRRRLAELFGVWETRNGSRAPELNAPAAIYLETRGGSESGGSDDHAGVDIGRTYTQTPFAETPEDFLAHIRGGHAQAGGEQGSAAKWAHAALALAVRSLSAEPATSVGDGAEATDESQVSKRAVTAGAILELARRVVADGGERGGSGDSEISAGEASGLLSAWLDSVGFASDPAGLLDTLKAEGFRHSELERRARRIHEARLAAAARTVTAAVEDPARLPAAAEELTSAFIPAIPYVASATVLGGERARLRRRDPGDRPRVALVVDGAGSMHGVTHTVEWVRERGVPGWDVEVVGTDARVDRRLPAVAELETPFYPGLHLGVPSAPELVETLAGGNYDLIHLTAPGPAGVMAAVAAKIAAKPLAISHHTDLVGYARTRSGDPGVAATAAFALRSFLEQADVVLSPSEPADRSVEELGIDPVGIARWGRGVDLELYDPAKRDPDLVPGEVSVLYVGRLSREKGVDLLAESFELARERDPRLHLVLAGGGPEEQALRERLGDSATFLGWVERDELARVYASADLFCFASQTDTYGQVITEAQASGLPVVAVAEGGPAELIRHGADGYLCRADACEIASAIAQLGASPYLRGALGDGGRAATRARGWSRSLEQLGRGYELGVARARRRIGASGAAHRAA
ncbi:glycosyltransferase [Thermoleophilia bacterium SCSIO 60948]|nr:glycosyltransferase [Thermoleophilia bacterium SCSIO 60948]